METVPSQIHPVRFFASRGYTKELQAVLREIITDRFDLDQKVSDLVLKAIQEARQGKPASYLTRFFSNQAVWSNERLIAHVLSLHQTSPRIFLHPIEGDAKDLTSRIAEVKAYKLICPHQRYIYIGRQPGFELQPGWEMDGAYVRPGRRTGETIITLTAAPPSNWDGDWINQPEPIFTLVLNNDVRTMNLPAAIEQAYYNAIAENNLLAHEVEELEKADKNLAARFQPYQPPSPRLSAILPIGTIIASIIYNIHKFTDAYQAEWLGSPTPELVANTQSKMHSTRTAAIKELESRGCVHVFAYSDSAQARIKLADSAGNQPKKSEVAAIEDFEIDENQIVEAIPPAWEIDDFASTYNSIQQTFVEIPSIHIQPYRLTDCIRFVSLTAGFQSLFYSRRYPQTRDELEIRSNRLREALPLLNHQLPIPVEGEPTLLNDEQALRIFSAIFDGESNPSVLLRSIGMPDLKTGFAGAEIYGGTPEYPLELTEGTGARKRREAIIDQSPHYRQILETYVEPSGRDYFKIIFSMTTLVRQDPGSLQAYFLLISSLYHIGKYQDAICFFTPIIKFLSALMKPHKGKTLSSVAGRNLHYIGIFYFFALCQAKIENEEATFGYSVPILEHAFFGESDIKSQVTVELRMLDPGDQIDLQFKFTQDLVIS